MKKLSFLLLLLTVFLNFNLFSMQDGLEAGFGSGSLLSQPVEKCLYSFTALNDQLVDIEVQAILTPYNRTISFDLSDIEKINLENNCSKRACLFLNILEQKLNSIRAYFRKQNFFYNNYEAADFIVQSPGQYSRYNGYSPLQAALELELNLELNTVNFEIIKIIFENSSNLIVNDCLIAKKYLLKYEEKIKNFIDIRNKGYSLVHWAVACNNYELLNFIKENLSLYFLNVINKTDFWGDAPIHLAVKNMGIDLRIIDLLVTFGADCLYLKNRLEQKTAMQFVESHLNIEVKKYFDEHYEQLSSNRANSD